MRIPTRTERVHVRHEEEKSKPEPNQGCFRFTWFDCSLNKMFVVHRNGATRKAKNTIHKREKQYRKSEKLRHTQAI